MMIALHAVILAGLVLMLLVVLVNAFAFRALPRRGSKDNELPFLSVLIPARNEEANIGRCLASLRVQQYPAFEILVLDDGSTDNTRAVVETMAASDSRVRCIAGAPLPDGWTGKNHACHQLALEARGDLLLFTDADTEYQPDALLGLADTDMSRRADLLSLIPRQRMESFWEKTFMPMLQFVTMCYLPFPLVSRARSASLAMANGQCMLFRRDAYDAIGGHSAVRGSLVEDVWLARAVKRAGLRLRVMDGAGTVDCRMYSSLAEIRAGFAKNLFPGLDASVVLGSAVFLWSFASGVLPFLLLPLGLAMGESAAAWFTLVVAEAGVVLLIRGILAVKFRMSAIYILLHPLAQALFLFILADSAQRFLSGRGAGWKGRAYGRKAEGDTRVAGGETHRTPFIRNTPPF